MFYIKISVSFIVAFLGITGFATAQNHVVVTVDLKKTHQTIDNFGASDAWSCQFVGQWPDEKKNKIADLLFSCDNLPDGTPKGIGLSLWRFNIGAGSVQQGQQSDIRDEWRRTASFLNKDGSYNWNNQAGQLWFLRAAKARNVSQFLGFCNSAPINFTVNGKAHADSGRTNLKPDKYWAFADYLVEIVKGVKRKTGISFDYISPVNEPQWDWSNSGQEGCPFTNTEIAGLIKVINTDLIQNQLSAKLIMPEAGNINYLYKTGDKPNKGLQIYNFFNPASSNFIGDLPGLANVIASHSYFTTSPMPDAIMQRKALSDSVSKIRGLKFWQSEYCILGDNGGEIDGNKRDLDMDAALYLARVIHTDLTAANASAWQWWTAISAYDYKDGLIYIDKNKNDGNFYASKMLWSLGNYSRFVRPGAVRVDAAITTAGTNKPLLVSAYRNGENFTAVIINPNVENVSATLNINGIGVALKNTYTTSQTGSLQPARLNAHPKEIPVKARSVVTVTGLISDTGSQ